MAVMGMAGVKLIANVDEVSPQLDNRICALAGPARPFPRSLGK